MFAAKGKRYKGSTQTKGKKKTIIGPFLDSEYCRNTFDIFLELLDRSGADSGTQFPNVSAWTDRSCKTKADLMANVVAGPAVLHRSLLEKQPGPGF